LYPDKKVTSSFFPGSIHLSIFIPDTAVSQFRDILLKRIPFDVAASNFHHPTTNGLSNSFAFASSIIPLTTEKA